MGATRLNPAALAVVFASPAGRVAAELERRAIAVEAAAKRLCPVDTGRLRASITHGLAGGAGGRSTRSLFAFVGTDVEYAAYVEFGTSRTHAQPFLRPALAAARGSR